MRSVQLARRFAPADWGGTETVILETSRRLIARGCPTEILCTTATDPCPHEQIAGVPVTRVPYFYPYLGLSSQAQQRLDKKGGSPFSVQMLARLAAVPGLDLIHCHVGNRLGGIGRFVARRRGIPYVVSIHGGLFDVPPAEAASWTAPAEGALEWGKLLGALVGSRRLLDDAAAILCVGHRESELARERLPGKRVLHLPNGVDAERFAGGDGEAFRRAHGLEPDALVLLTVARIDAQKNQRLLVRALPELLASEPRVRLLIIGNPTDPAYLTALERDVAERDLGRFVHIVPGLPARSQALLDAYHAADVFVLPSIHEPFGIVVLEAWAAGLPVVASRVGGLPHFVADGEDGLLFRSDDAADLCDKLRLMLASQDKRRALAAAGAHKARGEYSWDRITDRLLDVYREVIREAGGRA
jgi:glycosyltransferase involved in cell wall biosynthesis